MTDQPAATTTLGPCCCGRIKELSEPLIINGRMHERLGEPGSFCGPVHSHDFRDLEAERDRLVVVNEKLIALVDESLAFVAVWAATYQHTHDLADIHPKHQETIDKIRAALAEARA